MSGGVATRRRPDASGGIELRGLSKSFPGPDGPIEAVRSIDVEISGGGDGGPARSERRRKVDHDRHAAGPAHARRRRGVRVRALAVTGRLEGAVGAMLQTGALIRDLSVRELIAMMASLYPAPLDVGEVLELSGVGEIAGQRTQKLSGGQTQRVRFAVALVSNPELLVLDEPTVAMDVEGRRAFWTIMRAFAARGKTIVFATHYLEEADAYADRAVLMAHGSIVADGPTTEIRAMVGTRTIRATLPDADIDALAGLAGVSGAERHGESVILSCADSDAAIRALLADHPDARDIEITAAGLEQAFLALTGDGAVAPAGHGPEVAGR